MQPQTYIRVAGFADLLRLFESGIQAQQVADPLHAGATDTYAQINTLRCELQGYILTKPTRRQLDDMISDNEPPNENTIAWRAFCENRHQSGRWHIQRALANIGYSSGARLSDLKLKIDTDPDGAKLPMGMCGQDVRASFTWLKDFAKNLDSSLAQRQKEEDVWEALRTFTHPAVWRRADMPAQALSKIAEHVAVPVGRLEAAWTEMQPKVSGLLGPLPPGDDLPASKFRSTILLPALAPLPKHLLRRLIATAVLTSGNAGQLERDMKAIRELWLRRTTNIALDKLQGQVRLHLNEKERAKQVGTVSQRQASMTQAMCTLRAQSMHRDGRGEKRGPRSDRGGTHQMKSRRLATHLTEADVDGLGQQMLLAASAVSSSPLDSAEAGDAVVSPELLGGV